MTLRNRSPILVTGGTGTRDGTSSRNCWMRRTTYRS